MFRIRTPFVIAAIAAISLVSAQATDPIAQIVAETRDNAHGLDILKEIVSFGPRSTASDALLNAQHWAVQKFRALGVDEAHLEEYMEAPVRFQRGPNNSGGLAAPYRYQMPFSTPAYTVGTNGPVAGPAVRCPDTLEAAKKTPGAFKGAWVLMPRPVGMGSASLARPTEVDKYLDSLGIAGRIYSSTAEKYVWTHGSWSRYTKETLPKTPLVVIDKADFGLVTYNLDNGRNPVLEFNVDNKLTDEKTKLYNVVAEIKGSSKPDEYVIVSGHFDSWDGPGSQGAMDNGTGCALVFELARTFAKLHLRPARTIRFILWSGEEQGLLGSRGYVEKHKDEIPKIQAVLVEDEGQNPYEGIAVEKAMEPYIKDTVSQLASAYPQYPFSIRTVARLTGGGSDHNSFIRLGVPGFQLDHAAGPVSYTEIWHTQNDRISYVQQKCIAQNATYVGALAYHLADMPDRLPRVTPRGGG